MRYRLAIALILGLILPPLSVAATATPAEAATIGAWQTAASVTLTTTTEVAVLSTGAVTIGEGSNGLGVKIDGVVNLTPGTTTTAVVLAVRAGAGLGGAVIAGSQVTATTTAGSSYSIPFAAIDPTLNGTVQYTLTLTQVGSGGNGTANKAVIGLTTIASF
jgi:hypothetical protein